MKKPYFSKLIAYLTIVIFLSGCMATPKGFLKPDEKSLEFRQLQMRQYETKDQNNIMSAVAGVLQDLGFTIDDSETDLGFIAASTKADATSGGQIAAAAVADVVGLAACFFGLPLYTNALGKCDKEQLMKVSVITQLSLDESKTTVRVTFQRIVWNLSGDISKIETVSEAAVYQKFYDNLSKAIFLEAEEI